MSRISPKKNVTFVKSLSFVLVLGLTILPVLFLISDSLVMFILFALYGLIIGCIVCLQIYLVDKTVAYNQVIIDKAMENEIAILMENRELHQWQEDIIDDMQDMIIVLKSFEENNAVRYAQSRINDLTMQTLTRYVNMNLSRQISSLRVIKMLTTRKK